MTATLLACLILSSGQLVCTPRSPYWAVCTERRCATVAYAPQSHVPLRQLQRRR